MVKHVLYRYFIMERKVDQRVDGRDATAENVDGAAMAHAAINANLPTTKLPSLLLRVLLLNKKTNTINVVAELFLENIDQLLASLFGVLFEWNAPPVGGLYKQTKRRKACLRLLPWPVGCWLVITSGSVIRIPIVGADNQTDIMGAGASLLQEDKNKPADASDITSLELGQIEIRRLRLLAQQNPGTEFDIEAARPADASDVTSLAKAKLEIARLRTLFRIKVPSLDRVRIVGELHWEESELARATKECQEVLTQSHALLKEINPVQLGQVAATTHPTPEFGLCMQAVLTLLRQFNKQYRKVAKWQTALLLLKNMQFLSMLMQFPVRRISATTIGKLQKCVWMRRAFFCCG